MPVLTKPQTNLHQETSLLFSWPGVLGWVNPAFEGAMLASGGELFVLDREMAIGWAGRMIRGVLRTIGELCGQQDESTDDKRSLKMIGVLRTIHV